MSPRRLKCARLVLAFLFSFSSLIYINLISAQKVITSDGLQTIILSTAIGDVRVRLPDDIRPGDIISGTVIVEPRGNDVNERNGNYNRLGNYSLSFANRRTKVSIGELHASIPNDPRNGQMILSDEQGNELVAAAVAIYAAESRRATEPYFPQLGQSFRPYPIRGSFDGDSANTTAKIGDTGAIVIAESPRQTIIQTPAPAVGPSTVTITDNDQTTSGIVRVVRIQLSAPKTALQKGEQTELHVEVQGLQGINSPVQVQIQNQSSSNISLAGGDTQNIVVQPAQVLLNGTYSWTTSITAVSTGGFSITANVLTGAPSKPSPSPALSTMSTSSRTPAASPTPAQLSTTKTGAEVSPAPSPADDFYSSFTTATTDCCKKFLNNGVVSFLDDKGNGFRLDKNALTMFVDGKRYEWLFTQDGQPFPVAWMFCHLSDHLIISQLTNVMAQQVAGGKTSERSNTTSVSLAGPYRSEKSSRPFYGFQFGSQKVGSNAKEYSIGFSMDAETCKWSWRLLAEGRVIEFPTTP